LVERLADRENADIYVYSAQMNFNSADRLRRLVCSRKIKRENVILFMTTYGGDPDSAYRIAACLRRNYKKISVCIFGICKSAGTLAAIGADQLVFGDFGELGPLDVQLTKPGEIYATGSGLDIFQAFQRYLLEIVSNSEGHISAKTSARFDEQLINRVKRHIGDAGRGPHAVALNEEVKDLGTLVRRELVHAPEYEPSCLSCQAQTFILIAVIFLMKPARPWPWLKGPWSQRLFWQP